MDGTLTSLYTVALPEEADPIIRELDLRRVTESGSQPIYVGEDAALIISGIGKVKAAAATARLFSLSTVSANATAINFGIAGGIEQKRSPLATLFLIHRIVDAGSSREFIPDMIVSAGLPETTVTTFDVPVTRRAERIPDHGLVDMEAAGYFETATLFTGPHRIVCLKVVSDHLEGKRLVREQIRDLAQNHAQTVVSFVREVVALNCGFQSSHTDDEIAWIETARVTLRLTVSQTHMLKDWVIAHRLSGQSSLPKLTEKWTDRVKTKTERNRRFEALRKQLAL